MIRMFSLYRTLSLRYLSRRWFRAVLIVASIMLGVATLVATQALSETMSKATLASGNPMAGTLDFIVTGGEQPVERTLATELAAVPGVKSVVPRIFGHARLLLRGEKRQVLIVGIEMNGDSGHVDELTAQFELDQDTMKLLGAMVGKGNGKPPPDLKLLTQYFDDTFLGTAPAILGRELDRDLQPDPAAIPEAVILGLRALNLDKTIKFFNLEKQTKQHNFVRVASIAPKEDGELTALGGYVVILGMKNAARVLGVPDGKVRRLDIALHPGQDAKKVRKLLEPVLAGRATLVTIDEQNQSLQSASVGMRTAFSMCGVAALIVGMFLVYNALSVSVAERRHEIGILLALGATRDQVWRLFAGEACVLGIVGAALGIPVGIGMAYLGLRPMQDAIGDIFTTGNFNQIELTKELVALAFAGGILSSVIASLVPAIQAAYDKPAEAVRRVPKEKPVSHLVMHVLSVCLLVLGGLGMILTRDYIPKRWGTYGGLSLVMIGALLAAPLCAQLGARLLRPISRSVFAIEWRIAADNLVRAPGRTGMVIGALAAGVCLIVETAGITRSNKDSIRNWVDATMSYDLVISAGSPIGSGGQNELMNEDLERELRNPSAFPEIEEALPLRLSYNVPFRDEHVVIAALEVERLLAMESQRLGKTDHADLYARLAAEPNAVIVSHNFAALHHVHKGDTITLPTPQGPVKLHVIGTMVDYTWAKGTILMHRRDFVANWKDRTVSYFDVYLKPGTDATQVKNKIAAKLGAQHDLHPLTRAELKDRIDAMIERLYGIALGQEVVVVMVAALGVVTALLISVLQRRREIGLLRAIGASRGQVVYLVLAEAGLMGIFGSVLGVLFAIPLQWYALQIVFPEETGFSFDVFVPWLESVVIALSATLIATLAGVGPAIYAVRERIPDAIAYE